MQPMEQRNKTKRFGARFLLPVVLVVLLIFIIASTATAQTIMGDVNGDGKIDVRDVVLVQKQVLGKIALTAQQLAVADVNGDELIDARDVVLIMQRALGKISSFPLLVTKVDEVSITVPLGTPQANIGLPAVVVATISDGAKRDVSVQWETTSTPAYDPNVLGSYVFMGNLINLPSGITNPYAIKAKATVTVAFIAGPIPLTLNSVTVTGTPVVGGTLTSTLSPLGATAVYQWQASPTGMIGTFTSISLANSSIYIPVAGDVGYYIRVSATGSGGYTGTVNSNPVGPVISATTYGVTIETIKTTAGVTFVPGAFTSGEITAAPASAVYDGYEDKLTVADNMVIAINWSISPNATGYSVNHLSGSNTATAQVYVYAPSPDQNLANAITAAIIAVKGDTLYNGLLKATVAAATKKVNISGIEETAPALDVNLWKFEVGSPNPGSTGFTVYQHNKTVADQVNSGVVEAVYHVDSVKAAYKITVTNGATASGNLIVNVKDTSNAIDVDVSVPVIDGNTVNEVASRIKDALEVDAIVAANYVVTVSGADVTLTQITGKADNISVILK